MADARSRPRLVIDTNVFISGLISGVGSPAQILRAVQYGRVNHVVSDPIVEEYLRGLDYPHIRKFKKITDEFIAGIASYLVYQAHRVEVVSSIKLSRDPDDDIFLETAVDGKASLLVSNDKAHLLSLKELRGIPIVSAREAVKWLAL